MFKESVYAKYQVEAGDVVPFKRGQKIVAPKAKPQEDKQELDWIDREHLDRLKERFKEHPEIQKTIDTLSTEGHGNPYYGKDSHQIIWRKKHEKSSAPFPLPAKVADLKGVLGKDVPAGHGDPFMWMDSKYKISAKLLEKNWSKPLQINTRSDLIAHDDYIARLNPAKHVVNIHVASLNEEFNKITEPGAPSVRRRMQAAAKLASHGIKVFIVHDKFESDKMSETLRMVNEVTRSGINNYVNIQSIKSFMKENIVKLTDQQAAALSGIADEISKLREAGEG